MNEREWVESVVAVLRPRLLDVQPSLEVSDGTKLPYAHEVRRYQEADPSQHELQKYETDILVTERVGSGWIPRVVVEAKLSRISTHAAITYSHKASTHKAVHPYLRYGIFLGAWGNQPLPGRLYRHGTQFDFMISWQDYEGTAAELNGLVDLVVAEVAASRNLEEILFDTRSKDRKHYTLLHKRLELRKI